MAHVLPDPSEADLREVLRLLGYEPDEDERDAPELEDMRISGLLAGIHAVVEQHLRVRYARHEQLIANVYHLTQMQLTEEPCACRAREDLG